MLSSKPYNTRKSDKLKNKNKLLGNKFIIVQTKCIHVVNTIRTVGREIELESVMHCYSPNQLLKIALLHFILILADNTFFLFETTFSSAVLIDDLIYNRLRRK